MRHISRSAVATASASALLFAAIFAVVWAPQRAVAGETTPVVVYDAAREEFSLRNAPEGDLFVSLKGLMPGDVAKQDLAVEVVNSRGTVSVYAVARYADVEIARIEDVALSATFEGSGTHEGTLGDRHDMGEPVKLATLRGDGSVSGTVELRIPSSLDNETAGGRHALTWEFIAQHEGTPPSGGGTSGGGQDSDPDDKPVVGPDDRPDGGQGDGSGDGSGIGSEDGSGDDSGIGADSDPDKGSGGGSVGIGSAISKTVDGLGGVAKAAVAVAVVALVVAAVSAVAFFRNRRK